MRHYVLIAALLATPVAAEETELTAPEAVSIEEGLVAWDRVFEVTSHPRCSNCHVGPSNVPMWSGPSYGRARSHGMNINAGESRIGAEAVLCSTCHAFREDNANNLPHMAPQVAMNWQLAPVEAEWFGKPSGEICNQLRDPDRNGGRTLEELIDHLGHDLILHWAWRPGGGREPAPYSLEEHINDLLIWGIAGFPCATD